MPRFSAGEVAQRIRFPNGTYSEPIIVPMCKRDLHRFSMRIIEDEWPDWMGCLTGNGLVDEVKLKAKQDTDDFPAGSARLSCAHDGRYWRTIAILRYRMHNRDLHIGSIPLEMHGKAVPGGASPDRRLSDAELALLFGLDDERSLRALHTLGIVDPIKALARTVLSWLPSIEEWAE